MWTTRMVEYQKGMSVTTGQLKIGDMFFGPYPHELYDEQWRSVKFTFRYLSQFYHENNAQRRPLAIVLPGNYLFCLDGQCWNSDLEPANYGGWTVTGEPPNITVSPSINLGGLYHGFLQNGVLGEDVESRKYNEEGFLIRP